MTFTMMRVFGESAYYATLEGKDADGQLAAGLTDALKVYLSNKLSEFNVGAQTQELAFEFADALGANEAILEILSSTDLSILCDGLNAVAQDLLDPVIDYILTGEADWPTMQALLEDYTLGCLESAVQYGAEAAWNAMDGDNAGDTWDTTEQEEPVAPPEQEPPDNWTDEEINKELAPEGEKGYNEDAWDVPEQGSLSDLEAREWYLEQEARIPELIDTTLPVEQQAQQASELRNQFRTQARDAMSDSAAAEALFETRPNMTWEQIVEKYSERGYSGDVLYEEIIKASMRSNPFVNKSLGLFAE